MLTSAKVLFTLITIYSRLAKILKVLLYVKMDFMSCLCPMKKSREKNRLFMDKLIK